MNFQIILLLLQDIVGCNYDVELIKIVGMFVSIDGHSLIHLRMKGE